MAKQSGLGVTTLSVADSAGTSQDIRNDVTNWQMSTPRAVQDVTGVDKSAIERLLLLADFSITLNGVYNNAAGKSHAVFKTVPSTSVNRAVAITVNTTSLNNNCLFTDYAMTRAASGELTWSAPGVLADGTVPAWT